MTNVVALVAEVVAASTTVAAFEVVAAATMAGNGGVGRHGGHSNLLAAAAKVMATPAEFRAKATEALLVAAEAQGWHETPGRRRRRRRRAPQDCTSGKTNAHTKEQCQFMYLKFSLVNTQSSA